MQHFKSMLLGSTLMLLGSAGLANAVVITQAQIADGTAVQNIGGLTVTPSSSGFLHKTVNGFTGVGIADGSVPGEIDNQEFIRFTAPSNPGAGSSVLNGFAVAFLYQNGNMGDQVNEVALLNAQGAVLTVLTLTVSGPTTATLAGASGTVSNLSPATNAGAGAFRVSDLFIGFTSLEFRAAAPGGAAAQGDYSFVDLTYSSVPEPASMALLGTGLLGLGLTRRRKAA